MKPEFQNITNRLYEIARNYPEKPVFLHPKKMTFQEFCNLVDLYSAGFQKSGIKKGIRTVVLIKPGINLFAVTFALLRIGAIPVMIDPGMGTKAMARSLAHANPEAFVGIPKSILLKYVFPKQFSSVKIWISTGFNLSWQGKRLSKFRKHKTNQYAGVNVDKNDTVAVFFTSGSTGPAKGVVYKNYMFEAQLNLLKDHFTYNPRETDLCTFPLIGLFSVCLGLSVVLADMDMTRPATMNPCKVAENINRYNCTFMFCSPMVLKKLTDYCQEKNRKLLSLKKVMTAGAPVSPDLLQRSVKILSKEAEICTPYGATEALPVTDITQHELLELYKNKNFIDGICIGSPLKGLEVKIIRIDEDEIEGWKDVALCSSGEIGEIVVKGKNVTQSYFENESATRLSKIRDSSGSELWHRTGDLGRLDRDGRIWFYGRKSQRIITNYETLFTIPAEAVFNLHPAVERSALVGIKRNDEVYPVICIQLKSGTKQSKDLVNELNSLALEYDHTKNISTFLFHKKFPVDPRHNAKIYREKLAKWAQKKIT
jgi:acyl-CoA synthetase (AMP-forming)/AMP-acid ligase II